MIERKNKMVLNVTTLAGMMLLGWVIATDTSYNIIIKLLLIIVFGILFGLDIKVNL
jgi:hypothetical protein